MAVSDYRDDFISLIPALRQLINLGYEYLAPSEAERLRGGRLNQAVLDTVLRDFLSRGNAFEFKGETHRFSEFRGSGLKGQFAVSSREGAVKYKKYFDDFGDVSTEIIMSPPDSREDHSEVDESEIPEVQRFWKSMMDRFGSAKVYQDTLIDRFKKSDEPEILIVIDKLLTGFDAPRNGVLYLNDFVYTRFTLEGPKSLYISSFFRRDCLYISNRGKVRCMDS